MAIWNFFSLQNLANLGRNLAKNSGSCVCVCVSGTRARAILEAAIESHMWAKWDFYFSFLFLFVIHVFILQASFLAPLSQKGEWERGRAMADIALKFFFFPLGTK